MIVQQKARKRRFWILAGLFLTLLPGSAALCYGADGVNALTGEAAKKENQRTSIVPPWLQTPGVPGELLDEKNIRQGDMLEITVFPQKEHSASKYVDNEGDIFFPYLGKVRAVGMTVDELGDYLTQELGAKYLQNPNVFVKKDVAYQERRLSYYRDAYAKPITVFGEVRSPGPFYPLRDDITLIETIAQQGGYLDTADLNAIRLIRNIGGKEKTLIIDMGAMLQGKAPDIILERGDILIVPRQNKLIHVLGQVTKPGPLGVNRFEGNRLGLVEAISLAGGFTRIAASNRVRIVRMAEGKETTHEVNAGKILKGKGKDVVLEPGDVVVVPESFW